MSARLAKGDRMTVEQYLDWTTRQPKGRFELVDGVPNEMSPERNSHALVKGAVYRALRTAIREAGLDLVVLPDGPTVVITEHQSREPDVVVVVSSGIDWDSVIVDAPVILVEVTSPTTMRVDTDDKLIEYFSIASVRHYLLVHAAERTVVHHRRGEGGTIANEIVAVGALDFDDPRFSVAIALFFEDLPPASAN